MSEGSEMIFTLLQEALGDGFLGEVKEHGEYEVHVSRESLLRLVVLLKNDERLDFNYLMDLTAVDYLGVREPRFELVYHFYSLKHNRRLRVCVPVPEARAEAPTLCEYYKAADWYEREVWDLYGIRFSGHPDLRRLLLYDEFKGHPLRKDYRQKDRQPLIGPGSKFDPMAEPGDAGEGQHE